MRRVWLTAGFIGIAGCVVGLLVNSAGLLFVMAIVMGGSFAMADRK